MGALNSYLRGALAAQQMIAQLEQIQNMRQQRGQNDEAMKIQKAQEERAQAREGRDKEAFDIEMKNRRKLQGLVGGLDEAGAAAPQGPAIEQPPFDPMSGANEFGGGGAQAAAPQKGGGLLADLGELSSNERARLKVAGLTGRPQDVIAAIDDITTRRAQVSAANQRKVSPALGKAKVDQLNTGLRDRFNVLNAGKALPPQYTLSQDASEEDYARIDKLLESVERAKGTQAQRDQVNEFRRLALSIAQSRYSDERQRREGAAPAYAQKIKTGEITFSQIPRESRDAVIKELGDSRIVPQKLREELRASYAAETALDKFNKTLTEYLNDKTPANAIRLRAQREAFSRLLGRALGEKGVFTDYDKQDFARVLGPGLVISTADPQLAYRQIEDMRELLSGVRNRKLGSAFDEYGTPANAEYYDDKGNPIKSPKKP